MGTLFLARIPWGIGKHVIDGGIIAVIILLLIIAVIAWNIYNRH
jgi:hypothetical protein